MKAKKPIQTKFRMPLLNWVALKPSQITGTVFTELNDEKVLQVSVALPCFQCGPQGRRELAWTVLGHLLHPIVQMRAGRPGMRVKLNWIRVSDRRYILTPLEAVPSLAVEGTSGLRSGLSLLPLSFFPTTPTGNQGFNSLFLFPSILPSFLPCQIPPVLSSYPQTAEPISKHPQVCSKVRVLK